MPGWMWCLLIALLIIVVVAACYRRASDRIDRTWARFDADTRDQVVRDRELRGEPR